MTRGEYEERRRALEEQHRADIALMNAAHEARLRSLEALRQEAIEREREGAAPDGSASDSWAHTAAELKRRRRNRLLVGLLDQLDAEHGPVDDALVEKYTGLLG